MEALACGTPVIAFCSGALPKIVEHGKTRFLVNSMSEMADAISEVERMRPEDCLEAARSRSALNRMTGDYLSLYKTLVNTS